MVTPDDIVVPEIEVVEIVEETVSVPSRSRATTPVSKYDAVWESEDPSVSIGLMVYTFSGEKGGVTVGPFKVVAPNLVTAANLVEVFMPVLHRANVFDEESE
jgi:hypothetical protein